MGRLMCATNAHINKNPDAEAELLLHMAKSTLLNHGTS